MIIINTQLLRLNLIILFVFSYIYLQLPKDTFNKPINSITDAGYFAVVCHTTAGFGDIYPVSSFGKIVVMIHLLLVFITIIN
jgi:hypothetical protein